MPHDPTLAAAIRELAAAVAALRSEVADVRDAVGRIEARLADAPADTSGPDRRRHPRVRIATAVRVLTDRHPGHALPATVVDHSVGGVGVIVDLLIPLGSYVTFLRPDGAAGGLEARVTNRSRLANVSTVDRPKWRLGCEFLRPPTADEFAAFGFAPEPKA